MLSLRSSSLLSVALLATSLAACGGDGTGETTTTGSGGSNNTGGGSNTGGADAGPPVDVVLSNADNGAACSPGVVYPPDNQLGFWAATRLTPSQSESAFEVTKVRYWLYDGFASNGNVYCSAGRAHSVQIWSAVGAKPPGSPTVLRTLDVAAMNTAAGDRMIELDVDPPVQIPDGEDVYISVQLTGPIPGVTCIQTCADIVPDHNFWSNKKSAPYSWVTTESLNVGKNYRVEITGHSL